MGKPWICHCLWPFLSIFNRSMNECITRMHSSRMLTSRSSGHSGGSPPVPPGAGTPPEQPPRAGAPWEQAPPREQAPLGPDPPPPPADDYGCGRCASYWNAFLFEIFSLGRLEDVSTNEYEIMLAVFNYKVFDLTLWSDAVCKEKFCVVSSPT